MPATGAAVQARGERVVHRGAAMPGQHDQRREAGGQPHDPQRNLGHLDPLGLRQTGRDVLVPMIAGVSVSVTVTMPGPVAAARLERDLRHQRHLRHDPAARRRKRPPEGTRCQRAADHRRTEHGPRRLDEGERAGNAVLEGGNQSAQPSQPPPSGQVPVAVRLAARRRRPLGRGTSATAETGQDA